MRESTRDIRSTPSSASTKLCAIENNTQIGDYTVVKAIGKGGLARTYIATRMLTNGVALRVCLKELQFLDIMNDEDYRRHFRTETDALATLQHPNIPQLLDAFFFEKTAYIAMEYVPGVDLFGIAKEARTPSLAAYVGSRVAEALAYSHQKNMLHRDVTPQNILVSEDGFVKLTDFGIARKMQTSADEYTQQIHGKPWFMAPEYIIQGRLSPALDLYSLGFTLYAFLANATPFPSASDAGKLINAQQGNIIPLHMVDENIPRDFSNYIETLLQPDPAMRPASAADVAEELQTWADDLRPRHIRQILEGKPIEPSGVHDIIQIESVQQVTMLAPEKAVAVHEAETRLFAEGA